MPGMTERDRLATDIQRMTWLADAVVGPIRIGHQFGSPPGNVAQRPNLLLGIWRRGLAAARMLGERVQLGSQTATSGPRTDSVTAH